ncbi:hypothetical protein L2E82_22808 [Cichorium intybus]|uniref:Uncharacterized protein n=1 Tax=Cichorium intybus TaxID=13427 RepID=A0ACB9DYS5_CICIN|nr:hypothetical protein L2E82_22808 [Cichorium intybus]
MNPMFHDHQEQMMNNGSGGGGGDQVNMAHDVESGRSQIGGWNGISSTAWHGLIDSPLMLMYFWHHKSMVQCRGSTLTWFRVQSIKFLEISKEQKDSKPFAPTDIIVVDLPLV